MFGISYPFCLACQVGSFYPDGRAGQSVGTFGYHQQGLHGIIVQFISKAFPFILLCFQYLVNK